MKFNGAFFIKRTVTVLFLLIPSLFPFDGFSAIKGDAVHSGSLYYPDFTFMGGLTFGKLKDNALLEGENVTTSINTGGGFGGLIGADFLPNFGIETGLFYTEKEMGLNDSVSTGSIKLNNLSLPVMFRLTPNPYITFHAGAYFGLGSSSSLSVSAYGLRESQNLSLDPDSGLILGASGNFPIHAEIDFVAAMFYEIGLKDISAIHADFKTSTVDLFIGLKYRPNFGSPFE